MTGRWLLAVVLTACAPKSDVLETLATQPRSGAPVVLVVRGPSESFGQVMTNISNEVAGELDFLELPMSKDLDEATLRQAIAQTAPGAVLLMDNPAVELYARYRTLEPDGPPGIGVMSLFLEEAALTTPGLTGIPYEVPAVTSLVNLRRVIEAPVHRVGVVHRPRFADFVQRQAELASVEGFEIVPIELGERPQAAQLRRALGKLRTQTDTLWVLNDNALLAPEMIGEVWLPFMKGNTAPVVVGIEPLVNTPTPFGTFAVLPDHDGLGLQTADLLFELYDAGWNVEEVPVQLPIAVTDVLHVGFARQHLRVREDQLDSVDRLVE